MECFYLMKNIELDRIDLALLRVLQEDGATSQASLSEKVGASAASCWRRIKRLEEAGVFGKTVRLVDPEAIGLSLNIFCWIKIKSYKVTVRESFEMYLSGQKNILRCYSIVGEWDYLIHAVTHDVHEYETLLIRGILTHDAVQSLSSHFSMRTIKDTTALPA
jgi:Lrp/AsnC family transcriptional regulator